MSLICHGRLTVLLLSLTIAQPFAALAQTNVPAPLPPAAQESVNKGITAAKLPDYPLAIRYFEEARKLSPDAPVIYLNLGLAESKIPGRELRAIAWFGAYLAAYPNAPNATAVKEQMDVLVVKNQSNTAHLIKTLEDAANQIPKSKTWMEDQSFPDERREDLEKVIGLWLENHNFAAALKIADNIPSIFYKPMLKEQIGFAQLKAGDLKGARQTFTESMHGLVNDGHVLKPSQKLYGERLEARVVSIAVGHARTGDIVGALKSADTLKDLDMKSEAQFNIAMEQARAGDVEGSGKTFKLADQTAERIHDQDMKKEIKAFLIKARKRLDTELADKASGQSTNSIPQAIQPSDSVSSWLKMLDDQNITNTCPLNTEPFLDLPGHLKSLPSTKAYSDTGIEHAATISDGLFNAATKLVTAQNVITGMLNQQARSPSKP